MVKDYLEFLSQLSKLSWIEKGKEWTKEKLLGGRGGTKEGVFPNWVGQRTHSIFQLFSGSNNHDGAGDGESNNKLNKN